MIEPTHRNAKILIVDDQEFNLRFLERILTQGGYNFYRSLTDSRQTIEVYESFQPDLILLDLMMPNLDGVAVMEQLRPLTKDTYLPVVVLTADATGEGKRRALAAGAKDFLTKPLDAVEVLLRINNLLETRSAYQQLRNRADERIREQAALLDRANDAILVHDMEDHIRYWNHGAERLYGWTAAEAIGRNARELLDHGPASDLAKAADAVIQHGKWEGEFHQRNRDGADVVVASRWTLVSDNQGRPKSKLIINTDIREKKKLEAQLIQAQRMEAVGLLAGGVAHDFNNLLTVIVGFCEMALGVIQTEEPTHMMIQEVRKAGERASTLVRQLLAFSRKQILMPAILDLNELVSDTEKMLRRLIGEDIRLVTTLNPDLGKVKADPGQIEQVIMNLAVNSRDAMPMGGELTIVTRNVEWTPPSERECSELTRPTPRAFVLLEVTDTGSGMDEATRARVFEPFFTTKAAGQGTGLGLATAYGIVKQSDGHIEVDSSPGRGTTFRIYLPRLTQLEVGDSGSDEEECVLPHCTGTVLLVEDEDSVRAFGSQGLRLRGYTVLEARDGEDALMVCGQHVGTIDLVVTDVVMPKMNGRQLADHLAKVRPHVRILFMSGYTDDTIVKFGVREAGMAFLQKPFTPSVLVRKVHEVLGH